MINGKRGENEAWQEMGRKERKTVGEGREKEGLKLGVWKMAQEGIEGEKEAEKWMGEGRE